MQEWISRLSQSKRLHKWPRTFSLGLISDMAKEEAMALLLSEVRKLRDGQEVMRSAQEETSQKITRSSGRRDPYMFKRQGNENQFQFNQDVEDAIAEVSAGLKKGNADDTGERGKLGLQKFKERSRGRYVINSPQAEAVKIGRSLRMGVGCGGVRGG